MVQLVLEVLGLCHQKLLLFLQVLTVLLLLVVQVETVGVFHLTAFLVKCLLDGVPHLVLGLHQEVFCDFVLFLEGLLVVQVLLASVINALLPLRLDPASSVLDCHQIAGKLLVLAVLVSVHVPDEYLVAHVRRTLVLLRCPVLFSH